jgi:hypothetical protein
MLVDLGWAQVHIISADARIQPDIISNSFLTLDDEEGIQDSICKPSHQSSPMHRQTFKSKSSKIDSPSPLRVLTINFQSINMDMLVDLGWAQVHIISADSRIQPDIS